MTAHPSSPPATCVSLAGPGAQCSFFKRVVQEVPVGEFVDALISQQDDTRDKTGARGAVLHFMVQAIRLLHTVATAHGGESSARVCMWVCARCPWSMAARVGFYASRFRACVFPLR